MSVATVGTPSEQDHVSQPIFQTAQSATSLRTRALSGIAWNVANVGGGFVMQIVRGIVLARLLAPEDFGLAGVAMGACALFGIFTNFGIGAALVQTPQLQPRCSTSAFWLQSLATLCVVLILCFASPWIAAFYGDVRLTPIICWVAAGLVVNGTLTVPLALMQRDLRFRETNVMWGVLRLASFALAIGMAASGWSYWSLVVPDVATRVLALPILLWHQRWMPRFEMNLASLRPIMSFSLKSFCSQCLATLNTNIDYVILGRYFSPEVFGLYFFGYQRVRGPLRLGTMSVRVAIFPALSRVQASPEAARRTFFQGMPILAAMLFPLATTGILTAHQFVPLIFGNEWAAATPLLQLFLIWTYFIPINLLVTANFQARGEFSPVLLDSSARAILMTLGLCLLSMSGHSIYYCAFWVVCVEVAGNTFLAVWGLRVLVIRPAVVLRSLAGPLASAVSIVAIDSLWWPSAANSPPVMACSVLLARILQAGIVAVIILHAVDRSLSRAGWRLLTEILGVRRSESRKGVHSADLDPA